MYKKILLSNSLSLRDKLKNIILYNNRIKNANKSWKKRHNLVFQVNREYRKKCKKLIELEHKKIWAIFSDKVNLETFRICANVSGLENPLIVPEEILSLISNQH
jgi:hypothetical protein